MLLTPLSLRADERIWHDVTGKYSVDAKFVTADDIHVVLERPDDKVIMVRRNQLSPEDEKYVADRFKNISRVGRDTSNEPNREPERSNVAQQLNSKWQFFDGEPLVGWMVGYGAEQFIVARQRGDIVVNDRKLEDLPANYEKIVRDVIASVDKTPLADRKALSSHLAKQGGGPYSYSVEGVQFQLATDGEMPAPSVTVPLGLLASEDAEAVAPGFQRWRAAQEKDVPDEVRSVVDSRESLMLDNYQRSRSLEAAKRRQLQMIELQLLAADAGVTDIWQVELIPPIGYGYPFTVVVPGQNSFIAQSRAAKRFPGMKVGASRKLSN